MGHDRTAQGHDLLHRTDRYTRFQELARSLAEGVNDVSTIQQSLLRNLDVTDAALISQARLSRDVAQQLFSIRTVPFGSLTERLYRILRQTSKELDKRANLEIGGAQTELDRSVLEKLVGPLEHLLRNALEAMEHQDEARVEISTRRVAGTDTDFVEIKVADNGPGFLRDIVHQAFEPYVTSKPKGTGLGLAIVKKLIEEHGGHINARNREQGGAEISILIPLSLDASGQSLNRRHDHRRERA